MSCFGNPESGRSGVGEISNLPSAVPETPKAWVKVRKRRPVMGKGAPGPKPGRGKFKKGFPQGAPRNYRLNYRYIPVCPTKGSRICRFESYKRVAIAPTKGSWIKRVFPRLYNRAGDQSRSVGGSRKVVFRIGGRLCLRVSPRPSVSMRASG